ncbi:MAG: helix-turn-helix domain-containing protein [Bacteroidota bacterium]
MNKDKLNKKIGQKIIELRISKGLSQSDLAKACNKDRQGIENLEKGKVNPTFYTLYEVAQALEVPVSALVDFPSENW